MPFFICIIKLINYDVSVKLLLIMYINSVIFIFPAHICSHLDLTIFHYCYVSGVVSAGRFSVNNEFNLSLFFT